MDDTKGPGEEDERRHRLEGLRTLAGEQGQEARQEEARPDVMGATHAAATATVLAAPARKSMPPRFWLRVGAAALVVCVAAAGILVWVHQSRPAGSTAKPIPDPLAIVIDPNFSCPREVAWSPDGSKVAVLGYRDCPSNGGTGGANTYQYGAIYVYDARGGGLLTKIQLDTPVVAVAAPHATATAQGLPNVPLDYSNLIWSPDGRRLAVQYGALAQESGQYSGLTDLGTGLLLANWAKGTVQVYPPLAALPAGNYGVLAWASGFLLPTQSPGSSYQPALALRWDLTSGTGSVVQVPLAASYAWDASGTLRPSATLPASPDATPGPASHGAVGNADGGASFSLWQAGWVNYPQFCTDVPFNGGTSVNCCPVTDYYTASLGVPAAWSPDGRYLVQAPAGPLGATGKIAQALAPAAVAPSNGCADPALAASLAPLPVRDAALKGALERLAPPPLTVSSPLPGPSSVNVAWSPDGQRLAVGYSTSIGVSPSSGVTVYGCANGKALATINSGAVLAALPAYERARDPNAEIAAMVWSPDSQRLLVFDPSHGVMLIVGAKSLGLASH